MLQQFVRGYFPETVMSPDGTEALAVGRVQGTMGSRHKNDSADRTPPGLSAVRTTTYNFDEKTSMDTMDQDLKLIRLLKVKCIFKSGHCTSFLLVHYSKVKRCRYHKLCLATELYNHFS